MSPDNQASAKRFLLISTTPPYGSSASKDQLDIALTCSVFEQPVTLLFLGDGVLQLLPNQQGNLLRQKNVNAIQSSLALYDIESIYVDIDALRYHDLEASGLHIPCLPVDSHAIQRLIAEHDIVLTI